jgi:flagellin
MASIINTNIGSLTAQRNLSSSQASLSTSMQRLSSGLRINSAKDDAAGLAISDRMTSQIRGANQAARNANDGISLAQTAEGALGAVSDNLQRMRELSVQAANGSLSVDDRKAVQGEVSQLKSEINRVANQTAFNGTNLLDGTSGGFTFQVGANANQTIAISSLSSVTSDKLGTSKYAAADGASITATPAGTDLSSLAGAGGATSLKVGGFQLGGVAITGSDMTVGANTLVTVGEYKEYMSKTVDAINVKSSESGVTAALSIDATSGAMQIQLTAKESITNTNGGTNFVAGTNAGTLIGISALTGVSAVTGQSATQTGIDNIDVGTVAGANKAMIMLDGALKSVNTMRADLGAVQNRFTSTVSNLQTTTENLSASRSRIQDADFAAETANLSRSQVLQQAGTAMVAQANQLPQGVLALLR